MNSGWDRRSVLKALAAAGTAAGTGGWLGPGGRWAEAQPRRGGTLIAGWEQEPGTFDNNINRGAVTMRICLHIYNQLVERDLTVHGKVPPFIPSLATSWQISGDGLTYTFKLREGVKFHDGTPFNAEAVKFNFERNYKEDHPFFHKAGAGSSRQIFRTVQRTEVVSDHVVRVVHRERHANFLAYLAHPMGSIASPEAVRKLGNTEFPNRPVGTGPFRFVERERGVKIVLERNDQYWGGAPYLDRVVIRPIPEPLARVAAIRTGEVDWCDGIPPDSIVQLSADPNVTVVMDVAPETTQYTFNFKSKPFSDKRVRLAANLAIDREAICRDIVAGTCVPALQVMGPGSGGYDSTIKGYGRDVARAKRLLAEAGYPNGFATTWWTCPYWPHTKPEAEFIQANLREIGIDVKLVSMEWQTFLNNVRKGLPPDVGAAWLGYTTDEPYNLERFFETALQPPNGFNIGWYSSPKMDALLESARNTTDEKERLHIYYQADRLVLEDAPWLLVNHLKFPRAHRKRVKGYVNPQSWYFTFRTVWLEG
jgi:peptide/nickel transport system substrate-binding protein